MRRMLVDNRLIEVIKTEIKDDIKVKTLFGNQNILGEGNIDLFEHDLTITKTNGAGYLTIYSSKNTKIDSLNDLKLICGDTFIKSCTGYIGSKIVVAINQTSFLLSDGTAELLTNTVFHDDITTI